MGTTRSRAVSVSKVLGAAPASRPANCNPAKVHRILNRSVTKMTVAEVGMKGGLIEGKGEPGISRVLCERVETVER
jgi:hypothetical protein